MAAVVTGAEDPIFAAIKAHKAAVRNSNAATAESHRLVALADAAVGPSSIQVLDLYGPGAPRTYVMVNCWIDLEKYVSPETDAELYQHCRAELDEQKHRHHQYLESISPNGDIDSVGDEEYAAEWDVAGELEDTVPTTLSGLLAMLSYLGEAAKIDRGGIFEDVGVLFNSLAEAAQTSKAAG